MDEKNTLEKSNGWKNVIIIILIIAVIALGGFIINDKFISKKSLETKDTSKQENKEEEKKEEQTGTVIEVDKVKANEKVAFLEMALKFALKYEQIGSESVETFWYKKENVVNDKELLKTEEQKFDFAFVAAIGYIDGSNDKSEICYNGEEASGCHAYNYEVFKEFYKNLFGEELTTKKEFSTNEMGVGVKDNFIYGSIWSGWTSDDGIILKFNSFKLYPDNTYELIVDVIDFDEDEYDKYSKYDDSIVTDGYEDLVTSKLKVKLSKVNDDLYTIKSLTAIK